LIFEGNNSADNRHIKHDSTPIIIANYYSDIEHEKIVDLLDVKIYSNTKRRSGVVSIQFVVSPTSKPNDTDLFLFIRVMQYNNNRNNINNNKLTKKKSKHGEPNRKTNEKNNDSIVIERIYLKYETGDTIVGNYSGRK